MYDLLLKLCKEKGINITTLCIEVTGSSGNLSTWKKGKINPDSLRKIADYFDVPADYLLGRSTSSATYSNNNFSNSTNIAFGEGSSINNDDNDNDSESNQSKSVDRIIIKEFDYFDENCPTVECPFCCAKVAKKYGDTYTEISVSPTECYQIIRMNTKGVKMLKGTIHIGTSQKRINPQKSRIIVEYVRCPYCSETSYRIKECETGQYMSIYPRSFCKIFPNTVPADVYKDYSESCAILSYSPSASATLSRRCIQKMIRQRWKIELRTLDAEINKIPSQSISKVEREALQALRKIGNIGAHPDKLLEVTYEDAEATIRIIEIFLQKWYVDEPKEQELLKKAISISEEKKKAKESN